MAEKISALTTEEYIEKHANRASKTKFKSALKKVVDVEDDSFDK